VFREGLVKIIPGGGGMYGIVEIPGEVEAARMREERDMGRETRGPQRTMKDF
jgi:PHP family Zn ribbon phosphoesterase